MSAARILLVDDHQIMRDGLRLLLSGGSEWVIVGSAFNSEGAWAMVTELQPDVVLTDLDMPGEDGIALTGRIRTAYPEIKVLVLTASPEPRAVRAALGAGANGYMLKSDASAQLLVALRAVLGGQIYLSPEVSTIVVREFQHHLGGTPDLKALSPRETEILKRIADGHSTKEIAFALDLSAKTIETHRQNLMTKLGVNSVAGLTKFAVREGLTTL